MMLQDTKKICQISSAALLHVTLGTFLQSSLSRWRSLLFYSCHVFFLTHIITLAATTWKTCSHPNTCSPEPRLEKTTVKQQGEDLYDAVG